MKVIIDTDAGVDDAIALVMAMRGSSKPVELLGITCVEGNCSLDHVISNVLACCRRANFSDTKIYPGARRALLYKTISSVHIHGDDGLGGALSADERKLDLEFLKQHPSLEIVTSNYGNAAVAFLVKTIMESEPKSVNLVALGPLTNVAMAIKIEPRIVERIGRVVIMGGSRNGMGNITPTAEFNVFADPEAAHICFDHANGGFQHMEIVDWETTSDNCFLFELWEKFPKDSFIRRIALQRYDYEKFVLNRSGLFLPDPLAVLVLLQPDCVTESVNLVLDIELGYGKCRGMTVNSMVLHKAMVRDPPVHKVIKRVDINIFNQYLDRISQFK